MGAEEQIFVLRNKYLEEIGRVYDKVLQMKLLSVIAFNKSQYEKSLKSIEVISSIIEGTVMDSNPKRMLKYIVILRKIIDDFILQIDVDYKRLWDNKLTY